MLIYSCLMCVLYFIADCSESSNSSFVKFLLAVLKKIVIHFLETAQKSIHIQHVVLMYLIKITLKIRAYLFLKFHPKIVKLNPYYSETSSVRLSVSRKICNNYDQQRFMCTLQGTNALIVAFFFLIYINLQKKIILRFEHVRDSHFCNVRNPHCASLTRT